MNVNYAAKQILSYKIVNARVSNNTNSRLTSLPLELCMKIIKHVDDYSYRNIYGFLHVSIQNLTAVSQTCNQLRTVAFSYISIHRFVQEYINKPISYFNINSLNIPKELLGFELNQMIDNKDFEENIKRQIENSIKECEENTEENTKKAKIIEELNIAYPFIFNLYKKISNVFTTNRKPDLNLNLNLNYMLSKNIFPSEIENNLINFIPYFLNIIKEEIKLSDNDEIIGKIIRQTCSQFILIEEFLSYLMICPLGIKLLQSNNVTALLDINNTKQQKQIIAFCSNPCFYPYIENNLNKFMDNSKIFDFVLKDNQIRQDGKYFMVIDKILNQTEFKDCDAFAYLNTLILEYLLNIDSAKLDTAIIIFTHFNRMQVQNVLNDGDIEIDEIEGEEENINIENEVLEEAESIVDDGESEIEDDEDMEEIGSIIDEDFIDDTQVNKVSLQCIFAMDLFIHDVISEERSLEFLQTPLDAENSIDLHNIVVPIKYSEFLEFNENPKCWQKYMNILKENQVITSSISESLPDLSLLSMFFTNEESAKLCQDKISYILSHKDSENLQAIGRICQIESYVPLIDKHWEPIINHDNFTAIQILCTHVEIENCTKLLLGYFEQLLNLSDKQIKVLKDILLKIFKTKVFPSTTTNLIEAEEADNMSISSNSTFCSIDEPNKNLNYSILALIFNLLKSKAYEAKIDLLLKKLTKFPEGTVKLIDSYNFLNLNDEDMIHMFMSDLQKIK